MTEHEPGSQSATPGENQDPVTLPPINLVEQIIDATLSDAAVTRTVSAAGLVVLRQSLLAKRLPKPAEVVAAANHEEQPPETA